MQLAPFHLAIPVTNLRLAEDFYGRLLDCKKGRYCEQWIDWNFFGHQLVTHLVDTMPSMPSHNQVDNHGVPVPHFGVVLPWQNWQQLAKTLEGNEVDFIIEPQIRFKGKTGEQATLFFQDPSGNALEFKAFRNLDQLFAS